MTYNPNIPQPNHTPAQDQPGMLVNFSALNTSIGTEHVTPSVSATGKHKFVTFQQTMAPPAPVGTEMVMSQEIDPVSHKPYLRVLNSAVAPNNSWFVPLRRQVFAINVGGAHGTKNLYDFTNFGAGNSGGTVHVIDSQGADWGRHVFALFAYIGGIIHIPTGAAAQLVSGTTFSRITANGGSILQLVTLVDLPAVHKVTLMITESFL